MSLVSYSKSLEKFVKTLFPKLKIRNTMGDVISKMDLKQLRLSETEKYAHVTYFFNCGNEKKAVDDWNPVCCSGSGRSSDLACSLIIYFNPDAIHLACPLFCFMLMISKERIFSRFE